MTKTLFVYVVLFLLPFSGNTINAQTYFQQIVNYDISVKLDDKNHELTATEKIEYINNSPSTLTFLYFHLWPNAYRDNTTCLAKQLLESGNTTLYFSKPADRGYIDNLDFKVNGQSVKWNYLPDSIDICKIELNEPLAPGQILTITTPFHVKIPVGTISRLGHIGESYQITQWFPKPAVFDNRGWHQMPYLTQGEFYSEYGSFDVHITLPKNYVVGATGDLVNGESELLWLDDKVNQTKSIVDFSNSMAFPKSDTIFKTLTYHQEKVHDFAWFADKRFHVLKSEVQLPHTAHKVTTWAMFLNNNAKTWLKGTSYINDALYYYSLWNGDYPYNQCTAIDGSISAGGGMEYPNVTVIGETPDPFLLDEVIAHEVGHNWFYGILGSNERRYAWMDEGINSFNELRYVRVKYPQRKLIGGLADGLPGKWFDLAQYKQQSQYYFGYMLTARSNNDQPDNTPSEYLSEINYGSITYMKSATLFDYLRGYLGDEVFDQCMQTYFDRWKFKHPYPEDLRAVFEEITKQNLNWFFDDLIKTTKKLDYKILASQQKDYKNYVLVRNNGRIKGPVHICGLIDGKLRASIWYDGFWGDQWLDFPPGNFQEYRIDFLEEMPEVNRKNNSVRTKGIFKKTEPLRLQFIGSLENPRKTQLYYSPVLGWNANNKTMLGLALYNYAFPERKFEFLAAPMYATGTNDLNGFGEMYYNLYPNAVFRQIKIGGSTKNYSYLNYLDMLGNTHLGRYHKIAPEIKFEFKNKNARSNLTNTLRLRSITLLENFSYLNFKTKLQSQIQNIEWSSVNKQVINPYSILVDITQGKHFLRSHLELKYKLSYYNKKNGLSVRFFLGHLFNSPSSPSLLGGSYALSMSGNNDYLYDYIALDRYSQGSLSSQQVIPTDGAFKNIVTVAACTGTLSTLSFSATIPKLSLVRPYVEFGYASNYTGLVYNSGIALAIAPNIFEIYFPVKSNATPNLLTYQDRIRFLLNLNLLNPLGFAKNISDLF